MPNANDKEGFLNRLTEVINFNITNDQFGVNELAREMGMSRSNLHRKVKSYTGKSVSAFICDIKLDKAIQLLKESSGTIYEIAYECGFHSTTYFSKCFKDRFGFPPGEASSRMHEIEIPENPGNRRKKKGFAKKRISIFYFFSALFVIILFAIVVFVWKPYDEAKGGKYISIAVLPFINDSPDQSEMYFINGTMMAILNNLSKIEALGVIPRNSVEQYRDKPKPTKVVADELNVRYILIGSAMKQGDRIFLNLQLVDAKNDKVIWSESYEKSIDEVFELYSDVAQRIAKKIEATVTPTEKQLIEKIPTTNRKAWDLYLKGIEIEPFGVRIGPYNTNIAKLDDQERHFRRALDFDSAFADAYVELAQVYIYRFQWTGTQSPDHLDSVKLYIEKALYYDNQLSKAYWVRGNYNRSVGENMKAIEDFNKALVLNPNDCSSIRGVAWYYNSERDYKNALDYFHQLEKRNPSSIWALIFQRDNYFQIGCYDQSVQLTKRVLSQNQDSVEYYFSLAQNEYHIRNNTSKAIALYEKGLAINPDHLKILGSLAQVYYDLGKYEKALGIIERKNEILVAENMNDIYAAFIAGFIYKKMGDTVKANHYFDQQIGYCESLVNSLKSLHIQMAMAYSGKEDKEKAMEHLRALNQMERRDVFGYKNLQDNCYFECIQDDPEFKEIRKELIAKYEAEHQRVMRWLEENDLL